MYFNVNFKGPIFYTFIVLFELHLVFLQSMVLFICYRAPRQKNELLVQLFVSVISAFLCIQPLYDE